MAAGTSDATEAVATALPCGELVLTGDGGARAVLRVGARHRAALAAAVDAMAGLRSDWFWPCDGHSENGEGLLLSWRPLGARVCPLAGIVARWRLDPALHLPQALALARRLFQASGELEALHPLSFLLSPAQVFWLDDCAAAGRPRWLLLPLPLAGAGLGDYMRADDAALAWLSPEVVLHAAAVDRGYLVGAALYGCLAGSLVPPGAGSGEHARRLLLSRMGNAARARATLAAAVPGALSPVALRLADLVGALLGPELGRSWTAAGAAAELARFEGELAAPRLAAHWEEEGRPQVALAILEELIATAGEQEVPWEAVERLRAWKGDVRGAAVAASRRRDGPWRQGLLIERVRGLAQRGDAGRGELEQLMTVWRDRLAGGVVAPAGGATVSPATATDPGSPTDAQVLYLAYAAGRWLAWSDEAMVWLHRDFAVSSHRVLRDLITARLAAERQSWVEVTRGAQQGLRWIARMPDRGGVVGGYAAACLQLLDGIAHLCSVEQRLVSQTYLGDAFARLREAWSSASELGEDDLDRSVRSWMSWLPTLLPPAGGSEGLGTLRLGIEAFCQALGVEPASHRPAIPWFDERRLFFA